jgi:thiamine-monophosphate kinase
VARSEPALLAWLARAARGLGGEGLGDDTVHLAAQAGLVATVDTQIENVHYRPGTPLERVARRLLAVNLSDLAAAGARPRWALLSVSAPASFDHRRFFRGLLATCRSVGVHLVGGDLARSTVPTLVLTLLGEPAVAGRWLGRRAARPGDALWLGGTVGESAAGQALLALGASWPAGRAPQLPPSWPLRGTLARAARQAIRRHLDPQPQLALGTWLAGQERAATIDVSDGLALDLARLCAASGVGARLEAAALPASPGFAELTSRLERSPRALQLTGGEDYVLLFAVPPEVSVPADHDCRRIGSITKGKRLELVTEEGIEGLPAVGWDHLAR